MPDMRNRAGESLPRPGLVVLGTDDDGEPVALVDRRARAGVSDELEGRAPPGRPRRVFLAWSSVGAVVVVVLLVAGSAVVTLTSSTTAPPATAEARQLERVELEAGEAPTQREVAPEVPEVPEVDEAPAPVVDDEPAPEPAPEPIEVPEVDEAPAPQAPEAPTPAAGGEASLEVPLEGPAGGLELEGREVLR